MGLSRDFDRVTIEDDGTTIRVEATTTDEKGKPVAPDPATRMYVTLVALPAEDAIVTTRPETMPITDSSWAVLFKDADEKLLNALEVLCIGVAMTEGGAPEIWTERRGVKLK